MANDQPTVTSGRYGEVFDRGYAHYDGPRLGRPQAFRSLMGFSIKRAMGLRKSWSAKVLPFFLYTAAIVPLIVMIGIDAVIPDFHFASYTSYITWTFTVVGIFVAMAAPEMLCVDRRERTLPLYFSRAIGRTDYVAAKVAAMTLLTMTLSLVPSVILWIGRQLTSKHVWQAMKDNVDDLLRVIFVGSVIALVLGVIALTIASLTDRRGIAITVILVGFLVVTVIGSVGLTLLSDYSWSRYLIFLSLTDSFRAFSIHLFHDQTVRDTDPVARAHLSMQTYLAYFAAIVALGLLILRWRYRPTDD